MGSGKRGGGRGVSGGGPSKSPRRGAHLYPVIMLFIVSILCSWTGTFERLESAFAATENPSRALQAGRHLPTGLAGSLRHKGPDNERARVIIVPLEDDADPRLHTSEASSHGARPSSNHKRGGCVGISSARSAVAGQNHVGVKGRLLALELAHPALSALAAAREKVHPADPEADLRCEHVHASESVAARALPNSCQGPAEQS